MSFFPVVILPPSKARNAHKASPASDVHPWKTQAKRKAKKRKGGKVYTLNQKRVKAIANQIEAPSNLDEW